MGPTRKLRRIYLRHSSGSEVFYERYYYVDVYKRQLYTMSNSSSIYYFKVSSIPCFSGFTSHFELLNTAVHYLLMRNITFVIRLSVELHRPDIMVSGRSGR